jgi:peroxiredoxin-like protein
MAEIHSTYPFSVRWQGGKRGLASAPDGLPDIEVASPPEFGGPGGRWTPEHLFVGAATSCWLTTFLAVAELSRLELAAVEAAGEGVVERGDDRRFSITRIVLRARVTVRRELDRERALRLIQKAEESCLVARSMRVAVVLEPEVAVEQSAAPPPDGTLGTEAPSPSGPA